MGSKGKSVADNGKGKRKLVDDDKTGRRKKKASGVVQFFEEWAYEVDESDSSMDSVYDEIDDFVEEVFDTQAKVENELGKSGPFPLFPKEEEMTEEELKMLEERYKPGSSFVTYAEDKIDTRGLVDRNTIVPSLKDPILWKVKCMVGRERHSAFCLMQKYVDLRSLGTKLQIVSAFALEHVKGAIFIEADKQSDIYEACNGLCTIYSNRAAPVPQNEISNLLSVRSKPNAIAVGTWARVKSGKYKGDLAQVVAVKDMRKKATVKLIPRIDLQALASKFGGGVTVKKVATPAPRLICSSELEEFRPLIQYRRDRDTDMCFEILDGMMLKDGYLLKKVPIESLSFCGVLPSEDELLKFEPARNEESNDVEWLSQLYGEQKKKSTVKSSKGGGKGDGSSSSNVENGFEVHDMVFFSRAGFGVIIGREKDDSFKVLKEGSEGPVVVNVKQRDLKKASFDKKFTASDHNKKTITINDSVRILEGPLKGKEGIVRQIYRGTVFIYDEVEQENSGYFCTKAQNCEKFKLFSDACKEKGGETAPSGFEDLPSSPKSPLSPKKPWEGRNNNRDFSQGDSEGTFSVGQSLRIRVGPLKGYLCRVLALRRSDVTVKLDSQQKILSVKPEHLVAVQGKSSIVPIGDDLEASKPFDLLGTQDVTGGWMDGVGTSTVSDGWTLGDQSNERSSWSAFSSTSMSLQPESMDIDLKKDAESSAWDTKATATQNLSWGATTAVTDEKSLASAEQVGGWGKSVGGWNSATSDTVIGVSASDSWGRAKVGSDDQPGSSNDSWGKASDANNHQDGGWKKSDEAWGEKNKSDNPTSGWGKATSSWDNANVKDQADPWGEKNKSDNPTSGWGNANVKNHADSWGKGKDAEDGSTKAVWNTSTSVPEKESGGWGTDNGSRYNAGGGGRSAGRAGGRGGYGGRGSGGNACYKCGETGHMARECSQGGGGGGSGNNACYKCGETGHMARECSQGGGGGGNTCYKCGETGHMARECSKGGGNACYKCGESGHMARECTQGGGGGGNACYKCGETGHMARECSQGVAGGGERYGKSSWAEDNDSKKDGGKSTWATKSASTWSSSWGAAVVDDKTFANTEQVGDWGKSDGGWNKTTSGTGFGGSTSDSWGKAKVPSGDAAPSWGKNNDVTDTQDGGWKKSEEAWDKRKNVNGNVTSSWGNANNDNQVGSWGNGKVGEEKETGGWTSKAGWSTSTSITTSDKDIGGWGRGTSRGGGGNACYKCGETGHMARECSQGGGGDGGGNACYKCGETGHMARECSQGGGNGGNACYKCGETGHMARECSRGGGVGGRNCYKCGESGHMARDCSQGGGSYGKSSWSASSFSESRSANPLNSVSNDGNKDVGDSAWGIKVASNHNSSWSAVIADDKGVGGTEHGRSWGKSDGGWSKSTNTGFGSSATDDWGTAKDKSNLPDSGNDASWEKNNDGNNKDGGWKRSNEAQEGHNLIGNPTSNWSSSSNAKNQLESWGNVADKWSTGKSSDSKDIWNTPENTTERESGGWGSAAASSGDTDANSNKDGSWKKSSDSDKGDATNSWGSKNIQNEKLSWANTADKWIKESSGGSGTMWNNTFGVATENDTRGWGSAGGAGSGGYGGRGSGGSGNACYKCGETGHFARECSQTGTGDGGRYGSRSGGNECYKCGEDGHFARECPSANS